MSSPSNANLVRAPSLTPAQQTTRRSFRTATDFRVVKLLKHPYPSEFHSLAEYLHAGLLEGDPDVASFVPQPFLLQIGKERYIPDCYVVRRGQIEVMELKPQGVAPEARVAQLTHFFERHRIHFSVVANEAVLEREVEARNWLRIVQTLVRHQALITDALEFEILQRVGARGLTTLGDWVDPGDREASRAKEIAVLRLFHRGELSADLTVHRLDYQTELRVCP